MNRPANRFTRLFKCNCNSNGVSEKTKKVPQTHDVIGSKVSGHNDRLDISFKNQYIDTIDMLSSCYFQSMY